MADNTIQTADDKNFEAEVLTASNSQPVMVDFWANSAGRYRVQGIPTLLLFKNGQVVEQIVGAVPKEQITKALERHLA